MGPDTRTPQRSVMRGDPLHNLLLESLMLDVIKCPPAGRKGLQQKKLQSKQVMQQSVCALMTQRYVASCPGISCCIILVHALREKRLAMLFVSLGKRLALQLNPLAAWQDLAAFGFEFARSVMHPDALAAQVKEHNLCCVAENMRMACHDCSCCQITAVAFAGPGHDGHGHL